MRRRELRGLWVLLSAVLLGSPAAAREEMSEQLTPLSSRYNVLEAPHVVGMRSGAPLYRMDLITKTMKVDKIYRSMQGPVADELVQVAVDPAGEPELMWLVGYRAIVVEEDGITRTSQEFMCHSSAYLMDSQAHQNEFPGKMEFTGGRLFTLAQGHIDIDLPEGYGIPLRSNENLTLQSQILNHNIKNADLDLRHRISLYFQRDRDLEKTLKPLVMTAASGMVLVDGEDGYLGIDTSEANPDMHGPGCTVGVSAGGSMDQSGFVDAYGRKFAQFWVLPEGHHVFHTPVSDLMDLKYDTTIHYIATHLHPYATYMELRDLTEGKTVYRSNARTDPEKISLAEVEYFSSAEGLPLYKDHEYEVVANYDNTSGKPQDSMAVMYIYVHAKDVYDFYLRRHTAAK